MFDEVNSSWDTMFGLVGMRHAVWVAANESDLDEGRDALAFRFGTARGYEAVPAAIARGIGPWADFRAYAFHSNEVW